MFLAMVLFIVFQSLLFFVACFATERASLQWCAKRLFRLFLNFLLEEVILENNYQSYSRSMIISVAHFASDGYIEKNTWRAYI